MLESSAKGNLIRIGSKATDQIQGLNVPKDIDHRKDAVFDPEVLDGQNSRIPLVGQISCMFMMYWVMYL